LGLQSLQQQLLREKGLQLLKVWGIVWVVKIRGNRSLEAFVVRVKTQGLGF
jgi:uncharacterized membrane protein